MRASTRISRAQDSLFGVVKRVGQCRATEYTAKDPKIPCTHSATMSQRQQPRPCGCGTFVAFPPATTSPNLIVFGKNSDRPAGEGQTIRKYPRATYRKDADGKMPTLKCTYITIDQAETTHAVLLSQIDWMFGAEIGANEHGVVIGNEAIWTRDDCSSESKYLLGMDLVRLALERGDTARQSLEVITSLLEMHGQGGGCSQDDPAFTYHNSYLIVDPSEAWVLETSGRHWVAEQVKEGVRNISNCLSIRDNFDLSSDGIQEYAHKNGYWKVADGPLDFAEAFSTCGSAQAEMSDPRFCGGKRLLQKHAANGKMGKEAMIEILRDHGSGICMHGGGFETTSAWVSELYMKTDATSKVSAHHYVTDGPHPCQRNFEEETVT